MIRWLRDITLEDSHLFGGKTSALGELKAEGFNVANGFGMTEVLDVPNIEDYYEYLGGKVAVRSSSVAEDGTKNSFAGQYDTFLNQIGLDKVETAAINCFASLDNPRAIEYRKERGVGEDRMSVLVQRMVEPRASGVMFTYDTITDSNDCVLIEAVEGLGDKLVSGQVIPESYTVDKGSLYPEFDPDADSILSFSDVERLTCEAMDIEEYFNRPQDIEFVIDFDDDIWICQSRPVVI
jgi:pyruvate,water dikinase